MAYTFEYTDDAIEHIRKLPADRRAAVMDQLEARLAHQPTVRAATESPWTPTRSCTWHRGSCGFGDLRVYDSVEDAPKKVIVVAVGIKGRERLFIGGEEVAS